MKSKQLDSIFLCKESGEFIHFLGDPELLPDIIKRYDLYVTPIRQVKFRITSIQSTTKFEKAKALNDKYHSKIGIISMDNSYKYEKL